MTSTPRNQRTVKMRLLEQVYDVPIGIRLLRSLPFTKNVSYKFKEYFHKFNVLFLTFLSYASYHMARKPTSVVKAVLNQGNCTEPPTDPDIKYNWTCWEPFDQSDAKTLLGSLDSAFLFSYAFGMYLTGTIGERVNVRYFLTLGMVMSGIFGFLFGLAYWAEVHILVYFILVQVFAGVFQSTGWPGCVKAVGNWFGKNKRGMIMGVWRAHHSVGNIMGTLIAGAFVNYSWGLSFAVPAGIIVGLGILLYLFLVPDPRAVGCSMPDHTGYTPRQTRSNSMQTRSNSLVENSKISLNQLNSSASSEDGDPVKPDIYAIEMAIPDQTVVKLEKEGAIGFFKAVRIPGVMEYSFSLFFTKLINYTFLYWLPLYLKENSETLDPKQAADLSTLFDIGGIFGGILAGLISDLTGMSAFTCAGCFLLTIPSLFVYREYGSTSPGMNIFLLLLVGLLANGPYALITTAVSADLGTHPKLKGSTRAVATVTAIIDGTGSIGAAVGPLMAGALSSLGWDYVFYALMLASALGLLLLTRLMVHEAKHFREYRRSSANRLESEPDVTRSPSTVSSEQGGYDGPASEKFNGEATITEKRVVVNG